MLRDAFVFLTLEFVTREDHDCWWHGSERNLAHNLVELFMLGQLPVPKLDESRIDPPGDIS